MSDGLKSKLVDYILLALLSITSAAVGMLWTIKADASAVSANFAKVEAVTEEKIQSLRNGQFAFERRLERIETKLDEMPNMVARAIKGN